MTEVVKRLFRARAERSCRTCDKHSGRMDPIDLAVVVLLQHRLEVLDCRRYLIPGLHQGACQIRMHAVDFVVEADPFVAAVHSSDQLGVWRLDLNDCSCPGEGSGSGGTP